MQIVVTTNSGEVIGILSEKDVSEDLTKPLPRANLLLDLIPLIKQARDKDKTEH